MSQTFGGDRWWALVGPRPAGTPTGIITVPHDRYRTLAFEADVGPLHLRSGGTRLVEYLRSEPWRLDGVTVFETWPVIVEGDQMVPPIDEPVISAYGNPERGLHYQTRLSHTLGVFKPFEHRLGYRWLHGGSCVRERTHGKG